MSDTEAIVLWKVVCRPSLFLVIGDNFPLWKWRMLILLDDKGLHKIVQIGGSGIGKRRRYRSLQQREKKAYALIGFNLGDGQVEEIRRTKTTKETWDTLMKLNESSTMANVI